MYMANAPARRLRQAREKAGFKSAAEFARHCGTNIVTYQHHENGLRDMNPENAAAYAKFLNLPAGTLLFGERLHSVAAVRIFGTVEAHGSIEPTQKSGSPEQEIYMPDIDGLMALVVTAVDTQTRHDPGDTLFYEQLQPGRYDMADLDRVECVIKLEDGEVLLGRMLTNYEGQTTVMTFTGRTIHEARVFAASPIQVVRRHLPPRIANH